MLPLEEELPPHAVKMKARKHPIDRCIILRLTVYLLNLLAPKKLKDIIILHR
jgi:hypothetical protein